MAYFIRDKRIGEIASKRAEKIFEKNNLEPKFVDERGHDIVLKNGKKVEVKYDTWIGKTGNLSCEWWSDEKNKTEGWAQYSDADILVYLFDLGSVYVLDMKKLKEYVETNFDKLETKYAYRKKGGALNKLVPITQVSHIRLKEYEEMFNKYVPEVR